MELKSYQKRAIDDLRDYIEILKETNSLKSAWEKFWAKKDVRLGENGLPRYKQNLSQQVPQICFKIPTGGGKTFVACSALKFIGDYAQKDEVKFVLWLVPSTEILAQTLKNLRTPEHHYREKLKADFGEVNVYDKEELLNGAFKLNFNSINIVVMTFASVRIKNKDARRLYKENGALLEQASLLDSKLNLSSDEVDELSAINFVRNSAPVVIIDESHNATSELSIDMIEIVNPSFVLELSATPKSSTNVLHYTQAVELKKENMVKLPVYVINTRSVVSLINKAIEMQNKLENLAKDESEYVRPIVLFQAQNQNDDEKYQNIKQRLIDVGIPVNQIAIRVDRINEIKEDLLSPGCEIRYIITVNALKEGWDCPFAYILASLANRNSQTAVEQIVGRILRQPNARKFSHAELNLSYALTSSANFSETLQSVVNGLNGAGFSKEDYRSVDYAREDDEFTLYGAEISTHTSATNIVNSANVTLFDDVYEDENSEIMQGGIDLSDEISTDDILENASKIEAQYAQAAKDENINNQIYGGYKNMGFKINFKEAKELLLPKFMINVSANLFDDTPMKEIEKEDLTKGFTLVNKDSNVSFERAKLEIYTVDVDDANTIKREMYGKKGAFIEFLKSAPKETRDREIKGKILKYINDNALGDDDLKQYIDRIIDNLNDEQKADLTELYEEYAQKIKEKIKVLKTEYCEKNFKDMLTTGKIYLKPNYALKSEISPSNFDDSRTKTLYVAEKGDLNGFEAKVIDEIIACENVLWWHRNSDNDGFFINGFINHYPDFIVATKKGKIILVETKGDDRDNTDSRNKVRLGRKWADKAGDKFEYFMVFGDKEFDEDGAYKLDKFIEILKNL